MICLIYFKLGMFTKIVCSFSTIEGYHFFEATCFPSGSRMFMGNIKFKFWVHAYHAYHSIKKKDEKRLLTESKAKINIYKK